MALNRDPYRKATPMSKFLWILAIAASIFVLGPLGPVLVVLVYIAMLLKRK